VRTPDHPLRRSLGDADENRSDGCGYLCRVGGVAASALPVASNEPNSTGTATPLILEKDDGEKRTWRPIEGAVGWDAQPGPFIFKVDRHNGGSSPMVFMAGGRRLRLLCS
jgi:hypothetical protein